MPCTRRSVCIVLFVTSILLTYVPAFSAEGTDAVVIVNSGSTNISGFRIAVERSGNAEYTAMPRRLGPQSHEAIQPVRKKLPLALTQRLYSDLDAAKPLSLLPQPHCMKSVSFGSRLTLEYNGEKISDLSCGDGGSAVLQALIRDVKEITALFGPKRSSEK